MPTHLPPRKSPHPVKFAHPSVFLRWWRLSAAAVAVAVLTLLLASANAAAGEERPVAGASLEFNKEDGTLYIDWPGPIVAGMADDLRAALGKYETTLNRVVLFLDSAGGQVGPISQ